MPVKDWVATALEVLSDNHLHPWPELPPDWGFLMSPDVEVAIMASRGSLIQREVENQLLGYPVILAYLTPKGFLTIYRRTGF